MARRLEKIEKEMGYCEVKLEKRRRSRRQIDFLRADASELDQLIRLLRPHDSLLLETEPEAHEHPSLQAFLTAGLLDLAEDKRAAVAREIEELQQKLRAYEGFDEKREVLESEKRALIKSLASARAAKLRKVNDEFKRTERSWNQLTEDLLNVDEGVHCLERNLDYLKSARNFLLAAKGSYDVESWRRDGYLTDLFRHSSIGRAREMADGADRNLQSAQKEFACVSEYKRAEARLLPGSQLYVEVMIPFMEALYEDIFELGQIQLTIQVIEAALAKNLDLLARWKSKRDAMTEKLEHTESVRAELFQKMGVSQRGEFAF